MLPTTITNPAGERLAFIFTPGDEGRRTIVVLGHGLTSDKDRPWSEGLAAALAGEGIASLRFAFSGNGASEGSFLESNVTKEVGDLGAVLDELDGWRVAYVGHSMGGAVGLLRARADSRIRALVSLSAVTHAAEFARRLLGELRPGDLILGKPGCPFGPVLMSDLLAHGSLASMAAEVSVPWLVVHGEEDDVVPVTDSVDLHAAAPESSELVTLAGIGHSFVEQGLERMISGVVPWLRRQLDT